MFSISYMYILWRSIVLLCFWLSSIHPLWDWRKPTHIWRDPWSCCTLILCTIDSMISDYINCNVCLVNSLSSFYCSVSLYYMLYVCIIISFWYPKSINWVLFPKFWPEVNLPKFWPPLEWLHEAKIDNEIRYDVYV